MRLTGTAGGASVSGLDFDQALGLRSTLFTLRVTTAVDVPAVKGGSILQAPPETAPVDVEGGIQPGIGGIPGAIALPVMPAAPASQVVERNEAARRIHRVRGDAVVGYRGVAVFPLAP